jgi:hypothetical protein
LAVLDLGLEPLQVRGATADVRNVLPAAAELHDGDGAAHEQREEGDDHRQAKRDPDRDDDRRHARAEDGVLCVVLDGEENGSVAGHVEAFSEHAPHHLHLALHDREQDRLRLCAVLREQVPAAAGPMRVRHGQSRRYLSIDLRIEARKAFVNGRRTAPQEA